MTVYAIAQLSIHDRAAYERYQARFLDVFRKFKGSLLAADEHPLVLEGDWDRNKIIVMAFPDVHSFREWAESPEYRALAKDREAGANSLMLLVQGFASR